MNTLTIDFETRSFLDVRNVGAARYSENPTTEILCMSYKSGRDQTKLWTPSLVFPDEILSHVQKGGRIKAHYAAFEWWIWLNILEKRMGIPIPPQEQWADTMAACAYRALPLGLEGVGKALSLDIQKNPRGKYLLNQLSTHKKATKAIPYPHFREDWDLLEETYDYCITDTDSEEELDRVVGDLTPEEQEVWLLDRKINKRGMHVDVTAVREAKRLAEIAVSDLNSELYSLTDGKIDKGTKRAKLLEWLNSIDENITLPNLQKGTVEQFLADKHCFPDNFVRGLEIRQAVAKNSLSKLDSFLACVCSDNRIREIVQYHGATTGRFAGRLVQPHNFPRGTLKPAEFDLLFDILNDPGIDDKLELIRMLFGNPLEALSSGLRGMFTAEDGYKLMLADFAAIEARVVMWVAGCKKALEAFYAFDRGEGPDIYCVMAEQLYGRPINKKDDPDERGLGKVTILGCGYQMGAPRFQEQALSDYGLDISMSMAETAVYGYRNGYPEVKALWYGLQEAAIWTVHTKKPHSYLGITYEYVEDAAGSWLACVLPNGRRIWYYQPQINQVYKFEQMMPELSYMGKDNKKGGAWGRISTYGGMLTENVVQAIARDLMVEAMFRVEAKGYPIILTVHDEIVAEPKENHGSLEEFCNLMKGPVSSHFAGCPVNVEGWEGYRYRKV